MGVSTYAWETGLYVVRRRLAGYCSIKLIPSRATVFIEVLHFNLQRFQTNHAGSKPVIRTLSKGLEKSAPQSQFQNSLSALQKPTTLLDPSAWAKAVVQIIDFG